MHAVIIGGVRGRREGDGSSVRFEPVSRRVLLGIMLAALFGGVVAAGWVVLGAGAGTALSVARGAWLLAIGAVTGLLVLVVAVWRPLRRAGTVEAPADTTFARVAERALWGFAAVGIVAAVAAVLLHAQRAGDGVLDALGTRPGAWFAVAALAFAGLAAIGPAISRSAAGGNTPGPAAALVLLAVLNVAPALGGNAAVSSPAIALVPIEIVHVAAMGAWVGGLFALLLVVPAAVRSLPVGLARTRLSGAVLQRFSPVALTSVAVLTLAGTALSLLYLTTLYDLADTAYGRALFAKVVLLLIVIAIAVLQREYLMPRLDRAIAGEPPADGERSGSSAAAAEPGGGAPPDPEQAARHVRTAIRSEALLLVAVLLVTGALAGYPTPKTLAGQPATVAQTVAGRDLQLTVEPGRTGDNVMHLTVVDAEGGPIAGARELRVRAVPPGRTGSSDTPVDVTATAVGPGRWKATGVPLGARGSWKFELAVPGPAGEPVATSLPVRIR